MDVRTLAPEFSLSPFLHEHLQHRLQIAFAHVRSRVVRIVVRLADLNEPYGGRDKLCQINVVMAQRPEVVIREVQEDMYYAIDRAVKRAAYRTVRMLKCRSLSVGERLAMV